MASMDLVPRETFASKPGPSLAAGRIGGLLLFAGAFAFHLALLFDLLPA